MKPQADEHILVQKILAGDLNEFRVLIDRYRRLVSTVVFRLVDNQTDREEIGQQVFIKVYKNLARFQFKSNLATWIAKIAQNTCLNYLRKQKRLRFTELPRENVGESPTEPHAHSRPKPLIDPNPSPDDWVNQTEIAEFLRRELARLPVPYRKVISLYHVEQFSLQEIADIVQQPLGTVKSNLFRARKLLKERLLAQFEQEELCL